MHHGSCLCKAVRFEVTGDFDLFYLCHCEHCRKETGSAHAANLISKQGSLEWKAGQDLVKTWRMPDTRFVKSFCTNCGSALPSVHSYGVLVPAGSLDTKLDMKPGGHIFWASRADWDKEFEHLPRFEKLPT